MNFTYFVNLSRIKQYSLRSRSLACIYMGSYAYVTNASDIYPAIAHALQITTYAI